VELRRLHLVPKGAVRRSERDGFPLDPREVFRHAEPGRPFLEVVEVVRARGSPCRLDATEPVTM